MISLQLLFLKKALPEIGIVHVTQSAKNSWSWFSKIDWKRLVYPFMLLSPRSFFILDGSQLLKFYDQMHNWSSTVTHWVKIVTNMIEPLQLIITFNSENLFWHCKDICHFKSISTWFYINNRQKRDWENINRSWDSSKLNVSVIYGPRYITNHDLMRINLRIKMKTLKIINLAHN